MFNTNFQNTKMYSEDQNTEFNSIRKTVRTLVTPILVLLFSFFSPLFGIPLQSTIIFLIPYIFLFWDYFIGALEKPTYKSMNLLKEDIFSLGKALIFNTIPIVISILMYFSTGEMNKITKNIVIINFFWTTINCVFLFITNIVCNKIQKKCLSQSKLLFNSIREYKFSISIKEDLPITKIERSRIDDLLKKIIDITSISVFDKNTDYNSILNEMESITNELSFIVNSVESRQIIINHINNKFF